MVSPQIGTLTLPDGYTARARWWTPKNPIGAALYLHGIQSHGGWYEDSGTRLADAGLTVLMPDRRGSGLNGPPRGHFQSLQQCIEDTEHVLDALLAETGRAHAHVVGVSWGGKQATLFAQRRPDKVRTLSLVCPGLLPRVDLTTPEKFRVAVAMVNDRSRLFDIPLNDARMFTTNPARVRFVEADGLKLEQVSASFLLTSRRIDKVLRSFPQARYRGPIHLFLAGRDKIIDNPATRRWFRELPSEDRQLTEYREAEHTLEFEPHPEPFFRDLIDWIIARTP